MSVVVQAYRFALDPTGVQGAALRSHCGGQRRAFNWGLARVKANLAQRDAERSYGIADDQLTPSVSWSAYSLRKDWNRVKDTVAPWWAENSKEAYSSGLANLATALGNWADYRRGNRRGRRVGFPRFKGKRSGLSCRFTTGGFGLAADRRHVKLPRIGLVRTHESTRKLARHVERGTARIRSAAVSYGGRTLVRSAFCRDHPRRPGAHAARYGGGCGSGDQVLGSAVDRRGSCQSEASGERQAPAAPVAAAGRPSPRPLSPRPDNHSGKWPGHACPAGAVAAVVQDPGPYRDAARRCREPPSRWAAQAVDPPGP
jgi:helix-turn-helix protein